MYMLVINATALSADVHSAVWGGVLIYISENVTDSTPIAVFRSIHSQEACYYFTGLLFIALLFHYW
jgi:hypothetical protein